ncbi:MAG: DegV family protein [Eubacteriales bacterium]
MTEHKSCQTAGKTDKKKIAIATDTNSSIAAGENPNIYVLPMPVIVDGQTYFEGVDLCRHELYEAMKHHRDISTSQPSPGHLMEFWDRILEDGYDEIVYIPMSDGLSGSCHSAIQLAVDYGEKVWVVDNHRISVTQRESVYAALHLADRGCRGKEIKAHLEERAYDAGIYLTVDSMKYLKKGGRITHSVAAFATVLNLKPVLSFQGNKLDFFARARGMKQAQLTMIKAIKEDLAARFSGIPDSGLQIETAGTFEDEVQAQKWRQMVQEQFPDIPVSYAPLPCSIACHVGINAAGVSIMKKEVE